jgi:Domain of unknown function (DUF1735)
MTIQINKALTASFLFLAFCLSSCLKEKYDSGKIQPTHSSGNVPQVIELTLTATSNANFYLLAIDNSDADTTVNFVPVTLSSAAPAAADIHVTLALDDALIDAYNTAQGTEYEPAPADKYTLLNAEVTIPAGSNTGFLKVKFKPSDFIGIDYAFGLKIASIKESGYTISGNLSSGVAAVTIKNKYDGNYNAIGNFTHPNPDFTGSYNTEWSCATSGPTAVTFQLNVTVLFGVLITFTVDESNNKVALTRVGGALDAYDPALNYYDPATKTFHYDFSYSGGTRHCVGTAAYTGPR